MIYSGIVRLRQCGPSTFMKLKSSFYPITINTFIGVSYSVIELKHWRCFYFTSCCLPSSELKDKYLPPNADEFEQNEAYKYLEGIDMHKITQGIPEKIREFKRIQLEVDLLRQRGNFVPAKITAEDWIVLLHELHSKLERINYLRYRWLIEIKESKRKEKQIAKLKAFEEEKKMKTEQNENLEITTAGPIIYDLSKNSLFLRVYEKRIHMAQNHRLFIAESYGPILFIDCSYEPFMNHKNLSKSAKQLLYAWASNRNHFNPFHLIFCNINEDSKVLQKLNKSIQFFNDFSIPFYYTSKSYTDLFPKDKLVYLTPHAPNDLTEYNPDHIYIIGAFVDQCQTGKVSLSKSKKENLSMAKLPLDRYFRWVQGTKSLTINQCLDIMNDIKDTKDWPFALRHVPKRKAINAGNAQVVDRQMSSPGTKEHFRQNLVYDLLLKQDLKKKSGSNDE